MAHYTFQDITELFILPVMTWPRDIVHTYQKPIYKAPDRLKLCLFNWVNGFDHRLFIDFAIGRGALRDRGAVQDVRNIIATLERQEANPNFHTWYSFCLAERRWVYLDGRTKYY